MLCIFQIVLEILQDTTISVLNLSTQKKKNFKNIFSSFYQLFVLHHKPSMQLINIFHRNLILFLIYMYLNVIIKNTIQFTNF